MTGNGADYATERLLRRRHRLSSERFHEVIDAFLASQDRRPEAAAEAVPPRAPDARRLYRRLLADVAEYRHSL